MRIAQVTYSYRPLFGGADVYVQLLREVAEAAGHEVLVFQRPRPTDDPAVRLVHPPLERWVGRRAEFWTVPLGLRAHHSELAACDLIVAHYPNYHALLPPGPRTVLLSHGVFWDDRPAALRSRLKRWLARRAYRRADAVVANDTFFLREMGLAIAPGATPYTEVAPGRWYVPNGVDLTRFRPGPADPRLTGAILVPRNLYPNRGVHLAIEAYALARDALDGAPLKIVGGEGLPGYLERCRVLAERLGVAAHVEFLGPTPWEAMPAVYNAAALTVIPTLCGEGTSLAALESMACGTATVTTDVAGLADLPARRCPPTATALAAALTSAWGERETLGAQQLEAVQAFSLDRWRECWLGLFSRLAP